MRNVAKILGACTLPLLVTACERPKQFLRADPTAVARTALSEAQPAPAVAAADRALIEGRERERVAQGFVRRGRSRTPVLGDAPRAASDGDGISINLDAADLASVVKVMLEDGVGANYVIDPRVTGSVTLKTNRPLRNDEILPTLEEVLRLNNAALVERDGVFRIIPRSEAGLSAPLLSARDAFSRGLTIRVTPLRFVAVDDIAEVLDGFAPVAGTIRYDRRSNLVYSMASAAEQRTISNLIASLDVNQFAGRSFALRPLRESSAALVVQELAALFGSPAGADNAAIRFLAIDRINGVLIISDRADLMDQALSFVSALDQGYGDSLQLRVYQVTNRRASDLAVILGDIFNVAVSGAKGPPSPSAELGTSEDADDEASSSAAAAIAARSATSATGGPGLAGVVRIVADESSNTLVALANDAGSRAIRSALRQLDTQPLQVMIEATLVEVALNDTLEYGVRWFLQSGNFNIGFGDNLGIGATSVFPGFNAGFLTNDISVTISALDAVTDVRVLSAPTLMVLDNETARLQVGDQVPITTRSAVSVTDPDAPIVNETEFRDTGVILEISPTVSAGGLVTLGIRQEVSDVVDTVGDDNPTFSQRVIESKIAIQNGQTVALAGLIEEDASIGRDGIPVLSRIPVVGSAFGTTAETATRSELLVLIRPLVVRDQLEAQRATDELRRKLSAMSRESEPPPQ